MRLPEPRVLCGGLVFAVFCLTSSVALAQVPAAPEQSAPTLRWMGPDGEPLPFEHPDQVVEFLREARVVSSRLFGEGITGLKQLVLEHNGVTARGAFHEIDDLSRDMRMDSGFYRRYYDSYRGQCAAYEIARLLEFDNVPPVVCRRIEGTDGSVQFWIEDSLLEEERAKQGLRPPDAQDWMRQMQRMRLFDNLIFNDDRHARNFLYDSNWKLWLIDHTRAFQTPTELRDPGKTTLCERDVWERLQRVTRRQLEDATSEYLNSDQVRGLVQRHEALVQHIRGLIAERGEGAVLLEAR